MEGGMKKILMLLGIAIGITAGVLVLFRVAGNGNNQENGNGEKAAVSYIPVVSEEEAETILFDFKSLKKQGLSTDGIASVGESGAYIEIHKFADFMCPHCRTSTVLLEEAVKRWPGRIRIYYRHFPLDGTCNPLVGRKDPEALRCNGAQAALCAPDQNLLKEIYHGIFDFQLTGTPISPENLEKLAVSKGANWSAMLQCMGSAETSRKLQRDIKDAEKLNIQATPTLVVQDVLQPSGSPPREAFLHLLDSLVIEKEGPSAREELKKRLEAGN